MKEPGKGWREHPRLSGDVHHSQSGLSVETRSLKNASDGEFFGGVTQAKLFGCSGASELHRLKILQKTDT